MTIENHSSARVAEEALAILNATADQDGRVACASRRMAARLNIGPATASRVNTRLVETGAIEVLRPGSRSGPATYRVLRPADPDLYGAVPTVA